MITLKSMPQSAVGCGEVVSSRGFVKRAAAAAAAGFVSSFGSMVGFPSYMNIACAVMSGRFAAAALLGSLASYAISGRILSCAVQLGAMLVTVAMNIFFPYFSKNGDPVRLSLYTAAVNLLLSCVINAAGADSFYISMRIISSLMCACIVYAAAFVAKRLSGGEAVRLQGLTAVYCAMLFVAAVATLCSCNVWVFNLGRVLACAIIPCAAKKRRAAGGAVMGALTAISVTLCSSTLSVNTMLLAAAGLVASAFCDFGRVAVAVSFMLSAAAALATFGRNADTFNMLADIIAGAAIFAALPSGLMSKLLAKVLVLSSPAESAGQTASSRLTFAAMTIADIREKLTLAMQTAQARSHTLTLAERLCLSACGGCRLRDDCEKNGCMAGVRRFAESYESGGEFSAETAAVGCIKSEQLPPLVRRCREEQLCDRAEELRLNEMSEFMREQLASMSDILNDLSCRLSRRREVDTRLSAAVKSYFERQGAKGVRACVYSDENCCRRVEIYLSGEPQQDSLTLTAGLCRLLECDLELPGITHASGVTRLQFDESPHFRVQIGSYAALGSGSACSGDTLETVDCSAGERYILLSDGMGSGKRARLDSAMAVNLAAHLLRSGLSMPTAQRLINSILRVKGWEESFATLDLVRLDLFSGRAEFLKSGAAPAYLCRDGAVVRIGCDSYPAGILPGCDPDICACKLFDGDIIIIATDGAPQSVIEAFAAEEQQLQKPPEQIAFELGTRCKLDDDVTLAVVKLEASS